MENIITIIISLGWNQGYYLSCAPSLAETMGSELNPVILQTILRGLLGASFASSSLIWEIESWSIVKQTGIYFLITSIVMIPIAYLTNWMEHSILGFIATLGYLL